MKLHRGESIRLPGDVAEENAAAVGIEAGRVHVDYGPQAPVGLDRDLPADRGEVTMPSPRIKGAQGHLQPRGVLIRPIAFARSARSAASISRWLIGSRV